MFLNETLEFGMADLSVKRAFLGMPDKIKLLPGKKLYKWTDYLLVGSRGITPWWSFVEKTVLPSGVRADGFRSSEKLAKRLGTTHRSYQNVRAAVSEEFNNSMRHLLLVELTAGVWGFAGKASGQREFKDPELSNVYLIGGACQLWIPNLTISHLRQIPADG